jgi:hypothetical protein
MTLIKEPIDRITINQPPALIFDKISTALSESDFKILEKNDSERLITIRCIVELFNMLLWQSWGDKLQLQCMADDKNQTEIRVYGVPNLFRLKIKKDEKVYKKAEIAGELRKLIQRAATQSE